MKTFALASVAGVALAAPFSFPLGNGFPDNLTPAAMQRLHDEAGGTLPNGPLPSGLTPAQIASFQLIAANELFEVAYFTELYHNITFKLPGFVIDAADGNATFIANSLYRIRAQEEFHALGANAILKNNGVAEVEPCTYSFPITDWKSGIALAQTFTDVVLGVLPQVQLQSAGAGSPGGIIPLVGSIEEQEAQQVGWFRTLLGKYPSAAPFLTPSTPSYALSAISPFLVSCPAVYTTLISEVGRFPALTLTSAPVRHSKQKVSFSITGAIDCSTDVIAYITGQLIPVVVAIENVKTANGVTTFDAPFPADQDNFSDGLTIAAVVKNGTFASANDVSAATIYGPGLIEYN